MRIIVPILVVLGAVLAAALYWLAPAVLGLVTGGTYIDPMEPQDISALKGQYLEVDVLNLLDYYAQTIDGDSRTPRSREYLMPVATTDGDYVYIGVEVPRDKVTAADAVMKDTQRMLDDTDGSYQWDGSYVTVRGTLRAMDNETAGLYREYLLSADSVSIFDIGEDSGTFRTLVLVDGAVGAFSSASNAGILALFWVLGAVAWGVMLFNVVSGRYQDQCKRYLAAQPDPDAAEQQLDLLFEDPEAARDLRLNRHWLLCSTALSPWILAGDDVVWAYQHVIKHKKGLLTVSKSYMVRVHSASEDPKHRVHDITVNSEAEAQNVLELLHRTYPGAVIGWSEENEKACKANPAAFRQQAMAQAAVSAGTESIPGAEPEV